MQNMGKPPPTLIKVQVGNYFKKDNIICYDDINTCGKGEKG
jgi:hypothetical protein